MPYTSSDCDCLAGLFFWRLFRDDPQTSKALKGGSLALVGYGVMIFVFWYVSSVLGVALRLIVSWMIV